MTPDSLYRLYPPCNQNDFTIDPDDPTVCRVRLTKGVVGLVSVDDWTVLRHYRWYAYQGLGSLESPGRWYMNATSRAGPVSAHKLVGLLAGWDGDVVDHIVHRDPADRISDNRRTNLRPATYQQNAMNVPARLGTRSAFKGVTWRDGRWAAAITVSGIRESLGSYDDEREAAKAYDRAALKHFGRFAWLNLPEGSADKSVPPVVLVGEPSD